MQCLRRYEKATENFRVIEPSTPAPLFLSYVKLLKPVNIPEDSSLDKRHLEEGRGGHLYFYSTLRARSFQLHGNKGRSTYCRCFKDCKLEQGVNLPTVLSQTSPLSREELRPDGAKHSCRKATYG